MTKTNPAMSSGMASGMGRKAKANTPKKPEGNTPANVGPAAKKEDNKYTPKEKIGEPTIGKEESYVTRVGLGELKVITNGTAHTQPY